MDAGMANMNNYDSFFSFYRKMVRGIHGTAIFTRRDVVIPVKAEEGIGSALLPASMTASDRVGGYPLSSDVDLDYTKMKELDAEGRTTVIDTGMFVLINLCVHFVLGRSIAYKRDELISIPPCFVSYCPNETNDQRLVFKNEFNAMVDRRVRNLIAKGREVIVVGDLVRRFPLREPRFTVTRAYFPRLYSIRTSVLPTWTLQSPNNVPKIEVSKNSRITLPVNGSRTSPVPTDQ